MEDKSALLNQLRLDRSGESSPSGKGKIWIGAAAAILAAAALAAWWWTRPGAVPVHVASAQAIGGDGPAAAGSILDASGYVVARRQATVASKITAKMVELDIEEGDHVNAGQIIAKLDDTNIRAALNQAAAQLDYARASLTETQVNLTNAQRDYDRQKSLLQSHFVSQSAVDNSQTNVDALRAQLATQRSNVDVVARAMSVAERNLDDTIVRAPFAGIVTVKAAQPGEMVSPISAGGGFTRTGIGTIVDMDSLEIQVDVNENFINRVQPSQQVTAKLNAYPEWQIPAHVIAVIPTADRSKGTVTVRIALDQKDARILPEMGVRVSFLADSSPKSDGKPPSGVNLPSNAVQGSGSTGAVFVVHGDTVERRAVRLGASSGDSITILSGLAAGDRVAIGDFAQLKDGAKIRVEQ
ncbi:MAG TPA: efflux RND transporter periplasmic adaptor subunit [Steroidobacteraceae bacterium]|nr:efflux RND transporter periplasmic adaptor subunit [Steroidobacteraceae bacterium]